MGDRGTGGQLLWDTVLQCANDEAPHIATSNLPSIPHALQSDVHCYTLPRPYTHTGSHTHTDIRSNILTAIFQDNVDLRSPHPQLAQVAIFIWPFLKIDGEFR